MTNFLTTHICKGQKLDRCFTAVTYGRYAATCALFIALFFSHSALATWILGRPHFLLSIVVFMGGVYLLAQVCEIAKTRSYRWFETKGYVVAKKMWGEKLVTPSPSTIEKVHQRFKLLPNTVENALLEKKVRALKNTNHLPNAWWRELDAHLCQMLNIPLDNTVEVEIDEACARPSLWQRLKI